MLGVYLTGPQGAQVEHFFWCICEAASRPGEHFNQRTEQTALLHATEKASCSPLGAWTEQNAEDQMWSPPVCRAGTQVSSCPWNEMCTISPRRLALESD